MSRDDVIRKIRQNAEAIRALGADGLCLYGAYARDEAGPGSDVDIFVDRDPGKRLGFIELTELDPTRQGNATATQKSQKA